ncbi:NLRC3 [Symbiodinium sp. CCMP2592]|nr:NLRC3 [Symbiodinium sp. CCMP2592]
MHGAGDAGTSREFILGSREDFDKYIRWADIKFVRAAYLVQLHEQGEVWPRRQEAAQVKDALISIPTKFVALSHMWEAREHPDPFGFQATLLVSAIKARPRAEWDDVGFFIDYISFPQFRRSDHDEIHFRRGTQHMHLLFCNTSASFCKGVWSIPCRTPFWRLQKFVYGTCGCKGIPVYSVAAGEGDEGKVVTVPLGRLQLGDHRGKCGPGCFDRCPNLHFNNTEYNRRAWCRVEVEWAAPYIVDLSVNETHWFPDLCCNRHWEVVKGCLSGFDRFLHPHVACLLCCFLTVFEHGAAEVATRRATLTSEAFLAASSFFLTLAICVVHALHGRPALSAKTCMALAMAAWVGLAVTFRVLMVGNPRFLFLHLPPFLAAAAAVRLAEHRNALDLVAAYRSMDLSPEVLTPSSTVPMMPSEFQTMAREQQIRFTHKEDLKLVLDLQKQVFEDKALRVEVFVVHMLSSPLSSKLPDLIDHYKNLQSFDLRRSVVDLTSSVHLIRNLLRKPGMRSLKFCSVDFQPAAIKKLAEGLTGNGSNRHSLSELVLEDCRLQDDDVVSLAEALISDHTLRTLSLAMNHCRDAGALSLGKVLQENGSLRHLSLKFNCIGQQGVFCLQQLGSRLESLELGFNCQDRLPPPWWTVLRLWRWAAYRVPWRVGLRFAHVIRHVTAMCMYLRALRSIALQLLNSMLWLPPAGEDYANARQREGCKFAKASQRSKQRPSRKPGG